MRIIRLLGFKTPASRFTNCESTDGYGISQRAAGRSEKFKESEENEMEEKKKDMGIKELNLDEMDKIAGGEEEEQPQEKPLDQYVPDKWGTRIDDKRRG